ncbi:MAG: hypothetical protein FWC28_02050 [Proteobacteria bacterium]|nr:hypothetical protein [Cystobacterineae bacterium]MCL2259517.1 hypothetical protein [Cystobacterineae bacterium]MCL2314020.1 hypothetical protein [Pseudomonadota bacterium]
MGHTLAADETFARSKLHRSLLVELADGREEAGSALEWHGLSKNESNEEVMSK